MSQLKGFIVSFRMNGNVSGVSKLGFVLVMFTH